MEFEDAVSDGTPPVVAGPNVVLVQPYVVAALFQVDFDARYEFVIAIVSIA